MFGRKKKEDKGKKTEKVDDGPKPLHNTMPLGFNSSIPPPLMPFGDDDSYPSSMEQERMEKIRKFLDPKNPTHKYHVDGMLAYDLRQYDKAIKEFDRAIKYDPSDTLAHSKKGESLYKLGRYDEAIKEFDEVIRINPNDHDAHFNKGITLDELGKDEEALTEYDEVIRLNSNADGAYFNKGNVLDRLGRKHEAIASYDDAIKINPTFEGSHNNKANILKEMGKLSEAMKEVDLAIAIEPTVLNHLTKAEILANDGRMEEGIGFLREKTLSSKFLREELKEIISDEIKSNKLSENERQLCNKIYSEL